MAWVHPAVLDFVAELGMLDRNRKREVDGFLVVDRFFVEPVDELNLLLAVEEDHIGLNRRRVQPARLVGQDLSIRGLAYARDAAQTGGADGQIGKRQRLP